MIKNKVFAIAIMLVVNLSIMAQEATDNMAIDNLMDLSLEDLMNLEVKVGTISGTSNMKLPLSVTTIDKEEIELSNASNILHLIQAYVPGATYWRHNEGAMISLRGITSDRNTKILLLVNGLVVNQKAHSGVATELENWDMGDISRVEIIRGPGSVTYGPGAIAGVINIVTKSAGELVGFDATASYTSGYNNKTVGLSYGFEKENISGFFHAGVASTEGINPEGYYLSNQNDDFVLAQKGDSTSIYKSYVAPAHSLMSDFEDKPQIKFLGSLNFFKENTLTVRYNETSQVTNGYLTSQSRKITGFDADGQAIRGNYEDFMAQKNKQLIVSLKNQHSFLNDALQLSSEIAFIGGDYTRISDGFINYAKEDYESLSKENDVNSSDFMLNMRGNHSENAFLAKTMGIYQISDKYRVAAGVEYTDTHYGTGWGDDKQALKLGDGSKIVSGEDSYSYQDVVKPGAYGTINPETNTLGENLFYVGDGWNTGDLGFVAEANLEFSQYFNVVLSGRLDKNTYTDWLFSPRIAFISELNKSNIVKLIAQQSNKINSAEVLYVENQLGVEPAPESITNLELIYTSLVSDNHMFNLSAYYNDQDAFGWNSVTRSTTEVANVKMAGFELDYKIQYYKGRSGISHSFNTMVDYTLKEGVEQSILSYADYLQKVGNTGTYNNMGSGNDLRNVPNNMSKMYLDRFFKDKRYIFHTEFAVIWGYPGDKDVQGTTAKDMSQEKAIGNYNLYQKAFDEHDMFGNNYVWNATASARLIDGLRLTVGINNILGGENMKVYNISKLNQSAYYTEPRTFTFKLAYKL